MYLHAIDMVNATINASVVHVHDWHMQKMAQTYGISLHTLNKLCYMWFVCCIHSLQHPVTSRLATTELCLVVFRFVIAGGWL